MLPGIQNNRAYGWALLVAITLLPTLALMFWLMSHHQPVSQPLSTGSPSSSGSMATTQIRTANDLNAALQTVNANGSTTGNESDVAQLSSQAYSF